MRDSSWLDWPFFDDAHRTLAHEADAWCAQSLGDVDPHDADAACRQLVKALGEAGWLRYAVPSGPGGAGGGALPGVDSRGVCILRETLARHEGLADFAFAMQGLGSGAMSQRCPVPAWQRDRKSTRLNSSHVRISYAVIRLHNKIQSIARHISA